MINPVNYVGNPSASSLPSNGCAPQLPNDGWPSNRPQFESTQLTNLLSILLANLLRPLTELSDTAVPREEYAASNIDTDNSQGITVLKSNASIAPLRVEGTEGKDTLGLIGSLDDFNFERFDDGTGRISIQPVQPGSGLGLNVRDVETFQFDDVTLSEAELRNLSST